MKTKKKIPEKILFKYELNDNYKRISKYEAKKLFFYLINYSISKKDLRYLNLAFKIKYKFKMENKFKKLILLARKKII
tara:strand:+ start:347 stop:580 length:234 start_codon:yes stop_codon:yes gene_type:complete